MGVKKGEMQQLGEDRLRLKWETNGCQNVRNFREKSEDK